MSPKSISSSQPAAPALPRPPGTGVSVSLHATAGHDSRPVKRISFSPRTVFPGWAGKDTMRAAVAGASCRRTGQQTIQVREGVVKERPRLVFAGTAEGMLGVLIQHLTQQSVWDISQTGSLEEAESQMETRAPDLLAAVWTEEPEMKALVSAIRHHEAGSQLPIILMGAPPHGKCGASPHQPVRGVLCLPRPLKWRTLFLCLDEHLRALQNRPAAI